MADDLIEPTSINVGMTENQFGDATRLIVEEFDQPYDVGESGKMKTNVGSLVRPMQHKIKKKYAQAGVLSSMMKNGMGKSSLGYHICSKISPKHFSFERNFFFDGDLEDIKKQTDGLKTGNVLFMDELVRYWYNRNAMSKKSVDLNKWMAADQRKTGVILWGAIPDFWMLDPYLRNGRVDVYVECLARGWGVVFESQNFVKTDPWHGDVFDRLSKMRSKKKGKSTLSKDIDILQKHPCYKGLVLWNRMPDHIEKDYLSTLKAHLKSADEQVKEDTLDKFKREFLTQHEMDKARAWQAVINLSKFMDLRGIPLSRQLKEAGLDRATFDKYKKYFDSKTESQVQAAVVQDVERSLSGGRLERKPTTFAPPVDETLKNIIETSEPILPPETEQTNQEVVMAKPSLSFADRFPNLSNKRKFEGAELEEYEKKKNGENTEETKTTEGDGEDEDTENE